MTTRTDTLVLRLETDGDGQVRASLADTGQGVEVLGKKADHTGRSILSLERVIGGLSIGAMALMAQRTLEAAGRIDDLSQRIGVGRQALTEFQFIGEKTSVSIETIANSLRRQQRRVAEAAQGYGAAARALRELGIDAERFNQLAPEEQFDRLADALQGVNAPADRLRLAFSLWDTDGAAMLQTIQNGSEGLREMREEAQALGRSLSDEQVQQMATANQAIQDIGGALTGLRNTLLAEVAPSITTVAKGLQDFVAAGNTHAGTIRLVVSALTGLLIARTVGPLLGALGPASLTAARGMTTAAGAATALRGALAFLGGPAGVAVLAAGALAAWGLASQRARTETNDLRDEVDALLGKFEELDRRQTERGLQALEDQMKATRAEIEQIAKTWSRSEADMRALIAPHIEKLKELGGLYAELTEKLEGLGAAATGDGAAAGMDLREYAAAQEAALAREFEQLVEALATQEERVQFSYERRRMMIENAYASGIIPTEERFNELLVQIAQERDEELLRGQAGFWERYVTAQEEAQRNAYARVADFLRSDADREREAHQQRVMALEDAYVSGMIPTIEEFHAQIEAAETAHRARLNDIAERANEAQRRQEEATLRARQEAQQGFFTNLSSLMYSNSRRMFEVGRAGAISQTVIATYESATQSFKALSGIPVIGPALGAAAAAAAVAAGMANVQRIRSTSFGQGGGAVPTYSAGPGGTPAGTPGGPATGGQGGAGAGANSGMQITNVFQISGVPETVRAELEAMMPEVEERTRAAVMRDIDEGGDMAAAVGMR